MLFFCVLIEVLNFFILIIIYGVDAKTQLQLMIYINNLLKFIYFSKKNRIFFLNILYMNVKYIHTSIKSSVYFSKARVKVSKLN